MDSTRTETLPRPSLIPQPLEHVKHIDAQFRFAVQQKCAIWARTGYVSWKPNGKKARREDRPGDVFLPARILEDWLLPSSCTTSALMS